MGSIYQRGKTYWIKYYRNGKAYRESTKSKKEADAKRLLKKREGEIANGKLPGIYFDKVRFDELAEDFIRDYELNNRKTVNRAELAISHLKKAFEGARVTDIVTPEIRKYIETRIEESAANATINRELATLKRILNLGAQQTPPKVDRVPHIPLLKENNVRKGFFEHGEYLSLLDALPPHLKPFVTFAYKTGWRDTEIAGLTWNQVDLPQGIVRLETGETKNDEGRTIYLDDELKEVFQSQWENRKRSKTLTPYVFPNADGKGPIGDFRKSWNTACRDAGLGYGYKLSRAYVKKWEGKHQAGPILHDFRRTAIRNMVRAGIPERVAMMISGHKTRSVFDRYNIVDNKDLQLAAQKQQAYLNSQTGTITGTVADFTNKKGVEASANPL
jgi:integrase